MAARMSAAKRRELLVDAAIQVMAREGVAQTTTRAIVAEAGMQIGVFHYCFRSKEELILEVVRTIGRRSFTAVLGVLGDSTDPAELIHLSTRAYWEHLRAHPLEHLLSYELTEYALRQHEEAAVRQYADYYAGLERFLVTIAETGGCTWRTPVDQVARLTLAMIDGLTFQWVVTRDDAMMLPLLDRVGQWLCAEAGIAPYGQ